MNKRTIFVFLIVVMLISFAACSKSDSKTGNIGKIIYIGAMPDMTRNEIIKKYSGSQYSLLQQEYCENYYVSPVKNPKEFSYFGYPVDRIEIWFNSEDIVDVVRGRIDLSYERDVGSVVKNVYEQLTKYGTIQYKDSDAYNTEYTAVINNTEYAIYVYIYENPSKRSKQYMEVNVIRADSGKFGLKAP